MAELMVFMEDRPGTSTLKADDVVRCEENGFEWGRLELQANQNADPRPTETWHAKTVILRVPALTKADAIKLIGAETEEILPSDPDYDENDPGRHRTVFEHKWRINGTDLPFGIALVLAATGEATLPLGQLRPACDHKTSRAQFDETRPDGQGTVPPGRT